MKDWSLNFLKEHGERVVFILFALALCAVLWQVEEMRAEVKTTLTFIIGIIVNKIRSPKKTGTNQSGRAGFVAVAALLACCIMVAGCFATFKVNPDTGYVEYTRWGAQEISGLTVEKDKGTIMVAIEALKAESGAEDIKAATELMKTIRP